MDGLTFLGSSGPAYAYSVVVRPGPQLERQVRSLAKRHPLFRHQVPAHITVKAPFYLRSTGAIVGEQLEAVCAEVEPFELRVHGLSSFETSTIYARVDDSSSSAALRDLHQRLVDALEGYVETISDRYEGPEYTPHLTIASRLTRDDFAEAWRALAGFSLHGSIWVDRVHLLRGHHQWQVTRSFVLGV